MLIKDLDFQEFIAPANEISGAAAAAVGAYVIASGKHTSADIKAGTLTGSLPSGANYALGIVYAKAKAKDPNNPQTAADCHGVGFGDFVLGTDFGYTSESGDTSHSWCFGIAAAIDY